MPNKIKIQKLLNSAKKRKIKVDLKVRFWQDMEKLGCNYCGVDVSNEKGYCLDRFDNSKGYTDENISVCCKICNFAKKGLDAHDFYDWVARAYKHQEKCKNEVAMKLFTIREEDFEKHKMNVDKEYRKNYNKFMNGKRMRNSPVLKYDPEIDK